LQRGPEDWSDDEIGHKISKIISKFKLYECRTCAVEIMQWLKQNRLPGRMLRLKTKYDFEDYILSDRLERSGILETVTTNGTHYGIEVYGKIFDNLSQKGLNREDWLNDFHCPSEEFELETVEEF
jgi:hypothetical protein